MNRSLLAIFATALSAVTIAAPARAESAVRTRTLTPKPQRTVGFNGYATYVFHAPKGTRIIGASARIAGGASAVAIERGVISHNRARYTVSLVFPGEQGRAGKLVVRLKLAG